jgi:N-acetylglucosaminyldiphosphoundecaprenol N-acetyl-beta-D-mannosaminyltransferase
VPLWQENKKNDLAMKEYFGIQYEFDKNAISQSIDQLLGQDGKGYVCVADGVVLSNAGTDPYYRSVLNSSLFSLCDSGWVPLYIRLIYGEVYRQYSGSELFMDVIKQQKYNMIFLGGTQDILHPLRSRLSQVDRRIATMPFVALPFCDAKDFDYEYIAQIVNYAHPDIIWVGLGAPKQEEFMYRLAPHLKRGIMLGVGAVFKFFSGIHYLRRAPNWMVSCKIEWLYRLLSEPDKQIKRIKQIIKLTPGILLKEFKKKRLC